MSSKSPVKASRPRASGRATKFDAAFPGLLCGLDEVGRAPLAGPVVAACVFIPEEKLSHKIWKYIRDSKELTLEMRESLYDDIAGNCLHGIGAVEPEEIDRINIHHASLLAMKRAFEAMQRDLLQLMDEACDILALIDGKFSPALPCRMQTIIQGDGKSLRIGAASILAKVTRDRLMHRLHGEFPVYGWNSNVGYPTPFHRNAIREHGLTPHHRRSFGICAQKSFSF